VFTRLLTKIRETELWPRMSELSLWQRMSELSLWQRMSELSLWQRMSEMQLQKHAKLALGVVLTASLLLPSIANLVSSGEDAPPEQTASAAKPATVAALPKPPSKDALAAAWRMDGQLDSDGAWKPDALGASLREELEDEASTPFGPAAREVADPGNAPFGPAPRDAVAAPAKAAVAMEAPAASELRAIWTSGDAGRSVIELRADGTITNADVIPITEPHRLVIDLPDLRSTMAATQVDVNSDRVGQVRIGQHGEKVRIVLDTGSSGKGFEDRVVEPVPGGLRIVLGGPAALAEATPEAQPVPAAEAGGTKVASATDALPIQPVASIAPGDPPAPLRAHPDRNKLPLYLMAGRARGTGPASAAALEERYDCIIEPFELVEVGSALTAIVKSVAVERSDFVEAGQVLAQLEASSERATVAVAQARANMDGELLARRARMELGSRKSDRADQLFESEALSADLRDEIRTEAEVAKAVVQEAREHRKLMALEYGEAVERLNEHTIYSPVSGVVVDRLKSPGEVVKEETILVVAQIDPLRVEVILPAAAFGTVQPGMRAEVTPELPNAGVQVASVKLVDRVVDGTSGTFGVRLELPNSDYAVPSGLRCQVRFLPVD
jgi:RND family efflux transporter MFP subunit